MFPNPQEALPLPPRPNLEQYRKRAKDLANACRSSDPDAIRIWATRWIEALAKLQENAFASREQIDRAVEQVAQFAQAKLSADGRSAACRLSDAQFVIARAHGFLSWPRLVAHLEALAHASSQVSLFEVAADAIVAGEAGTLERLLRDHPDLIRARSTREHNATLLHYVSANGVENYRQKSPKNAARMTTMLLEAGAEVDAEADVYGGGCTTLGLVATSTPPFIAGVQRDVMDVLLNHGAQVDLVGSAGAKGSLIQSCLGNGQPQAAEYLAACGAPIDFVGAAGLGRIDILRRFLDPDAGATATNEEMARGFSLACTYGRTKVVEFLLDRGVAVDTQLHDHGAGHTGLHVAAFHGHVEVVKLLLRRGASVHVTDLTWRTPPLLWALTGWSMKSAAPPERFYEVVTQLVAAGSTVRSDLLEWDNARADPKMLAALSSKPKAG